MYVCTHLHYYSNFVAESLENYVEAQNRILKIIIIIYIHILVTKKVSKPYKILENYLTQHSWIKQQKILVVAEVHCDIPGFGHIIFGSLIECCGMCRSCTPYKLHPLSQLYVVASPLILYSRTAPSYLDVKKRSTTMSMALTALNTCLWQIMWHDQAHC